MNIAKELGDRFDKAGLVNIKTRAISVSVNQSDKLGQLAWYVFLGNMCSCSGLIHMYSLQGELS